MFDKINQKYTVIELDDRDDGDSIQDCLQSITGARTVCMFVSTCFVSLHEFLQVPRVFIKGNCIGGGSDVKAMQQSGELEKLLK